MTRKRQRCHEHKKKEGDDPLSVIKRCGSCGHEGHCNARSSKCQNHEPRQGTIKPISQDPDKCIKEVYTTLKCGFNNFITNEYLANAIQQQVVNVTKNSFYATRLLQFHLQRCIESDLPLPNLEGNNETTNWIRQIFTKKITDLLLQQSYDQLAVDGNIPAPSVHNAIKSTIYTRMIADYKTNLEVFYNKVYDQMNKKWFRHILTLGMTENGSLELTDEHKKQINQSIFDIITNSDNSIISEQYKHLIHPWKDAAKSVESKIRRIYKLNSYFVEHGLKQYNLCPQYSTHAKYIKIDTDVLYQLISDQLMLVESDAPNQKKRKRKMTMTEFGKKREDRWREYIHLEAKYFHPQSRKQYNCEIRTDGKGVSVSLREYVEIPKVKLTEEQLIEKRKQYLENKLTHLPPLEQIRWVGLDPGRVDIASASEEIEQNDTLDPRHKNVNKFVLSSKQYYHESKFTMRTKWKNKQLRILGLMDYLLASPSDKTRCSADTKKYLEYINDDRFRQTMDLNLTNKAKHKRWKTYIHKYKTLDRYCRKLINNDPNTVVAYGDASFCHNTRGNPSSLKGNWVRNRLEKVHKCHLLMTKEYNTSQVCSGCHHKQKLVEVGSQRDPFRFKTDGSTILKPHNSHFVRRCSNCRIIWNRDFNASQNQIFVAKRVVGRMERSVLFATQLATPDKIFQTSSTHSVAVKRKAKTGKKSCVSTTVVNPTCCSSSSNPCP